MASKRGIRFHPGHRSETSFDYAQDGVHIKRSVFLLAVYACFNLLVQEPAPSWRKGSGSKEKARNAFFKRAKEYKRYYYHKFKLSLI